MKEPDIFERKKRLLRERMPAKDISDVELSDEVYQADFEIGSRYSSFSTEIIRLSLLGLAGYGFLISEVVMKANEGDKNKVEIENIHLWVSAAGICFLGLALGFSLYHRFKCTSCLYDQILISRSLLRLRNNHWTEDEKEKELQVLDIVRKCQQAESTRYQNILGWSGSCLFLGFVAVIILFFFVMTNIA